MTSYAFALCTSVVLFTMGVIGAMTRRDLLRVVISVSIMLASIALLLVTLASLLGTSQPVSQTLVLFLWAVEIVEIIIAVTMFTCLARSGASHLSDLRNLRW